MKNVKFVWTETSRASKIIKMKLTKAPILQHLDFSNVFEVACNVSQLGIGGVLSQERHLIAYFGEKLNDAK